MRSMMVSRVGVAVAALLVASAAGGVGVSSASAPSSARLIGFRSCPDLVGYMRAQAARFVTPYGVGQRVGIGVAPGAAPAAGVARQQGVDYSGTNVQEAGVDEPDVVKTNGVALFAAENGQLESVSVAGGHPRLLDTLK